MQDKELEKILQEKADNTKIREFSEVWEEIKDEIVPQKKEKKSIFRNKFFLTFAPALLIICIALTPLIIKSLTPIEEVFYTDKLSIEMVTPDEAFEGLLRANITHVNLNEYSIVDAYLFYTEGLEVKGAHFEFFNENPTTFLAKMKLYDKSVELNLDLDVLYDTNIQVNTADVYYKFKSNSSGFYEYDVYATYNNVKYVIEYSGVTDNLMEFLNEFFA